MKSPTYTMTEEQDTALYQAKHLIEVLANTTETQKEFIEIRSESLHVTLSMVVDLLGKARPTSGSKGGES